MRLQQWAPRPHGQLMGEGFAFRVLFKETAYGVRVEAPEASAVFAITVYFMPEASRLLGRSLLREGKKNFASFRRTESPLFCRVVVSRENRFLS